MQTLSFVGTPGTSPSYLMRSLVTEAVLRPERESRAARGRQTIPMLTEPTQVDRR
jgi:hypothetical protein